MQIHPHNVAIIQARMGSSRFPGKMLAQLGGVTILEWVIRRLLCASTLTEVVLATSYEAADEALVDLASRLGIKVFRGSESDVLSRIIGAAKLVQADNVIRICADNPFVDSREIDSLVNSFMRSPCDYACNHQDRLGSNYADGFGAEILSLELLEDIAAKTSEARYREHATLFLWDHSSDYDFRILNAPASLAFPELRFDVDNPADLSYLESLVSAGVTIQTTASEIIRIAQSHCVQDGTDPFNDPCDEIDSYLQRLFPLCRSITGEPNRESLKILQEIIPLTICEVPTGSTVYDWTIPYEWTIRGAWIADAHGNHMIDFKDSNLHVVSYSEPVNRIMSWSELQAHIHTHPDLPNAIPYRTSYYKRDWGFCVTHDQFTKLKNHTGPLSVVIDSDLKPGSLSYGEYLIAGRSSQEILISCYICHPSMANDSLSGVLLTAFLARHLARLKNNHWSYRIIFVPETIGAIAYCARNEAAMKKIELGFVVTTVGGPGKFGYKQSFDSSHPINAMIEEVFNEIGAEFITYPFDVHGSDERQYSSQGFRINVATVCRDRYYEYPYYHSSLDNLNFVTAKQISETLAIYIQIVSKLEGRLIYRNKIPHCEAMLSRHDLYPATGGAQRPELGGRSELDLILWLLFFCDGSVDLESIADKLCVSSEILKKVADRLVKKNILDIV
jgi:aminopeptidase-like protein/spore coat polysaccharide biosynthesis protein SpsF (cytidylyltransferase family)